MPLAQTLTDLGNAIDAARSTVDRFAHEHIAVIRDLGKAAELAAEGSAALSPEGFVAEIATAALDELKATLVKHFEPPAPPAPIGGADQPGAPGEGPIP